MDPVRPSPLLALVWALLASVAAPQDDDLGAAAPLPRKVLEDHAWARVFVPGGVTRGRDASRRGRSGDVAWEFSDRALDFRWRVEPVDGRFLDFITIQDEGTTVRPLGGGALFPDDGHAAILRERVVGRRLVLEYSNDVEIEIEAFGCALRVDVRGGPSAGRILELGAAVPERGVDEIVALPVPYADHAAVACVNGTDGGVRFLGAFLDPSWGNASLYASYTPGEPAPGRGVRYAQRAKYFENTEGDSRDLRERLWLVWSDRLLDVLPAMDREPSPGRAESGDKFYVGMHVRPFADTRASLAELAGLGVEDAHVTVHHWQRLGYDRGYPDDVMPPREEWGGLEGLLAVRELVREAGWEFSLHHNWVFNGTRISGASMLDSAGAPATVAGGGHFLKSGVARELVDEIEGEMHDAFDTEGVFTDSLTAILPRVDQDARVEGHGLIRTVLEDWAFVLERLRAIHGAPVMGEGGLGFGGLLWAGMVDVVEGQIAMHAPDARPLVHGERQPVVPHFVLARRNPLDVRMGVAGFPKYINPGGDWGASPLVARDRDHMLAVATLYGAASYHWWYQFSRPGDAARDFWSTFDVARVLTRPDRTPVEILYEDDRGRLISLERYLALGGSPWPGSARVRVADDAGGYVWANVTPEPWEVDLPGGRRATLAPWGRYVVAGGVEAGLVQQGDLVTSFVDAPERAWLDGRGWFVERDGLGTDGGVGVRRLPGGRARLFPLEYRLSATRADGEPELVRPVRLHVLPGFSGLSAGEDVQLEWIGLDGDVVRTETLALPEKGLQLGWERFRMRGALSVVVGPAGGATEDGE